MILLKISGFLMRRIVISGTVEPSRVAGKDRHPKVKTYFTKDSDRWE